MPLNTTTAPPLTSNALFELFGLRLDTFGPPLTNTDNRGGDVEKRQPVTVVGAHIWPTRANTETNGERRKSRNHGQLGTCEGWGGVNELRGSRCQIKRWLIRKDSNRHPFG